jgi:hypothetical protein
MVVTVLLLLLDLLLLQILLADQHLVNQGLAEEVEHGLDALDLVLITMELEVEQVILFAELL